MKLALITVTALLILAVLVAVVVADALDSLATAAQVFA